MTRRPDPAARADLLDRIVDYASVNGISSLSLRPLAHELGTTAGALLYHFHSKEELTVAILKHAGDRQRTLFAAMRVADDASARDVCLAVWKIIGAPRSRALFALFFEVYGLALIEPKRFPGFFPAAVYVWLDFLARPYLHDGMSQADAHVRATITLANFRGYLLDLCATNDTERVDRAVALWISSWT